MGPLLRELSLALRGDTPRLASTRARRLARCTVLVRAAASPARVAREFKLLHRAVWDTLRRAGRIVAADERRSADEWLDEALAAVLERIDRVRMRIDLLERGPAVIGPGDPRPGRRRPPPLPAARPGARGRLRRAGTAGVVARPAPLPRGRRAASTERLARPRAHGAEVTSRRRAHRTRLVFPTGSGAGMTARW